MCIFDRIIPAPWQAKFLEGEQVLLGVPGRCLCRIVDRLDSAEPLLNTARAHLRDRFLSLLNEAPGDAGEVKITLALAAPPAGMMNPDQAYRLTVDPNGIEVTGFGPTGLWYGVITLCQLLRVENNRLTLPPMEILDRPELRTRGHMLECRYGSNLMTLADWKKVVDDMAAMKMNQIALAVYGCWNVQYDGRVSEYLYVPIRKYPQLKTPVVKRYYSAARKQWVDEECLPPMFEEDFFGELIAYGKTRGVEILPLVNSYGHNTLIPATFPEISAKDENGEPQLTGLCTRNEKTYEIFFTVYDEIIDRYLKPNGIESFHIGLDEVRGGIAQNAGDIFRRRTDFCQCPKCRNATKSDLFLEHSLRILRHLKEKGMKNIYIYHDMMRKKLDDDTGVYGGKGLVDVFERLLRENDLKREVVLDWWTYADVKERMNYTTTEPQYGIRRTVKPMNGYYHWNVVTHTLRNVRLLAEIAHNEGCEGMQSYSAWDESYDRTNTAQACYAWNFENTGSVEEATDRYVRSKFGSQFVKAKRAFELFDWITEERKDSVGEGDDPAISNFDFLMWTLGYYSYSYVREGKPYPRNFPGEAVTTLLGKRWTYERQLCTIAAMAKEAEGLWNEISEDPNVDQRMARRFAYDAANYLCLAEDYMALLRMRDLSGDIGNLECIRSMASVRKNARLALMEKLERNKEAYLIPSHQRNHSLFMQFFADLEGYLANTPAEQVKLDFEDLSAIATPAFKKLR